MGGQVSENCLKISATLYVITSMLTSLLVAGQAVHWASLIRDSPAKAVLLSGFTARHLATIHGNGNKPVLLVNDERTASFTTASGIEDAFAIGGNDSDVLPYHKLTSGFDLKRIFMQKSCEMALDPKHVEDVIYLFPNTDEKARIGFQVECGTTGLNVFVRASGLNSIEVAETCMKAFKEGKFAVQVAGIFRLFPYTSFSEDKGTKMLLR